MGEPNYNMLFQAPNAGQAFTQAFEHAQERRRQDEGRNALSKLVTSPDDPQALGALARADPATAMGFRKQQLTAHSELLKQHSDSILRGAEILRQFKPHDQASYTAALQAAQAARIDISEVPQEYNPQYVDGVIKVADALKPEAQHNGQLVAMTPGGSVARINPETGQLETLVAQNPGGYAPGTPVGGDDVPHVSDQSSYDAVPPGGQYMTPDGHIRVKQGGAGGNVSGNFPDPLAPL